MGPSTRDEALAPLTSQIRAATRCARIIEGRVTNLSRHSAANTAPIIASAAAAQGGACSSSAARSPLKTGKWTR